LHEVQALGRQVLALQERNQHRLARDLHDQVLQDLFVVRNLLEQTQDTFLPEKITQARQTLLNVATYLRSLLFEMRPPAWEETDLGIVLENYALTLGERHLLPVSFEQHGEGDPEAVPEPVRVALFRILQESLNNAWKHAGANQVEVDLELQPEHMRLAVEDDGAGFEVSKYLGPYVDLGKLGLAGMRERATEVGGTLQILSEPGRGTKIIVDVPLAGEKEGAPLL
jgi:two-component system sensor histidine kinase DegS